MPWCMPVPLHAHQTAGMMHANPVHTQQFPLLRMHTLRNPELQGKDSINLSRRRCGRRAATDLDTLRPIDSFMS